MSGCFERRSTGDRLRSGVLTDLRIALRRDAVPLTDWQRSCLELALVVGGVRLVVAVTDRPSLPAALGATPILAESALDELAKLAPDIVLDLGSRPANWDLAHLASFGLLAFRYDTDGGCLPIAVREFRRGQRAAFAHLLQLGPDRGRVATLETVTCKTIAHSLDATRARLEAAIADRPARHLRRLLSGAGLRLGPPPEACLAASRPSRLAYPTLSAARARNLVRRRLWEAAEERLHFLVWPAAIMRR
jgi:hypothetical protein